MSNPSKDIVVKYNGVQLTPTPLVQQGYQFIDYGNRWGNVLNIELNGNVTGITAPVTTVQSGFAAYFTGQFGTLEVFEGTTSIYQWNNVIIDEIIFPQNHLFLNSITPYSVKMKTINVPSGVVEPMNEYSFAQGEDGIVTVNHKVSARGIRNEDGALANAVSFVQSFMGINPFNAPFTAAFSPLGSGVLTNFTEAIDRANASYSIQEIYKYNTGLFNPYVETWTVDFSDVYNNEFRTVDLDWKLQGSPVHNNLLAVEATLTSSSFLDKIHSEIGHPSENLYQTAFVVNRDTGAATIQVRASFISGYSIDDPVGYFDYTISLNKDVVMPKEEWRIEGDFVCIGPRDYRATRLANFKTTHGSDWRGYLTGLIIGSPIYAYHDGSKTFGSVSDVEVKENTSLVQFHLGLTTFDGSPPPNFVSAKYNLEIEPNKWTYDLLPSANIEGHYVLQDLQMQTQGKIGMTIEGTTKYPHLALPGAQNIANSLSNIYIGTGFITSESYNTGYLDVSYHREWLGLDKMSSGLLFTKVAGTNLIDYLRTPGYRFGY